MTPERAQPPALSLEYEQGRRVAELRRRRLRQRVAVALALLLAVVVAVANRRSIVNGVERWQRDRVLARAMAKPARERFPDGEVVYTVPPGFYSRTVPPKNPAVYGPLSATAAAAAAELKAVTGGSVPGGPVVFLGALADPAGEHALVAIAFSNCSVRWHLAQPSPDWRSGYFVALSYSWVMRGQSASGGGHPGTRLAPLSALDWNYKWQDLHVAALPLTFYGGRVDPADPRVAVIPIKLGERRGRLRFWFSSPFRGGAGAPSTEVVWDE